MPQIARPPRNTAPASAAIDRWIDAGLAQARLPAAPPADDGEFLRRVTLDLIGRVPTYAETAAFLENRDPQKRAQWIDELLAAPLYGEYFASLWRELILPPEAGVKKVARDTFTPWLAEQFNRNQGWDQIVKEMLTAEGKLREVPATGFIAANLENGDPQPNLLADSTARLFWGVQLRCAECHDHPFASWKQTDFWGTAAFFSRLRKGYTDGKNPQGIVFTEIAPQDELNKSFAKLWAAPGVAGPAVLVPADSGKLSGQVVKANFLGAGEPGWTDEGPYRERFAQWATGPAHPFFAANTANRLWAHLFGRGLITPLDGFDESSRASHPELLALLAQELRESTFDLKHVIRAVCNSRAYQRSSRPVSPGEAGEKWLSHRATRVMHPEALYDSLSVVLQPPLRKGGGQIVKAMALPGLARTDFTRFFATRPDQNLGSTVNQGIPQLLSLLNGPLLNQSLSPQPLLKQSGPTGDALDALYLAAYTRRPAAEERQLIAASFSANADQGESAKAVLWALLNSAEFVTNH